MPDNVRNGALRGARSETGITEQNHRLGSGYGAQARTSQVNRGSMINYYDDLDINTSANNANDIREEEKRFNSEIQDKQDSIDQYNNKLNSAYGEANSMLDSVGSDFPDSYTSAIEESWLATQRDFVYVDVYNQDNSKVEGSYLLPRESVEDMNKNSFDGSEGHYASAWNSDGTRLNVNVTPVGIGTPYGDELHTSLQQGVTDTYNAWYNLNAPVIQDSFDEGYIAFRDAYNSLESQYTTGNNLSSTAQTDLDGVVQRRKDEWDTVRGNQKRRTEHNRGVLSNLKVESV